ncbi:MAG TPA: BamA/TamA family outer membrane protein [Candidatus Alistipes intestinipullorum]|nr:BamA/TamA family outer membrane protein [Candidatus Alistipes intestinipullorum]
MRPTRIDIRLLGLLAALLLSAACSTTRRIPEGEVLYTGVKKIRIVPDSGVVLTPDAESDARQPLSVAPNNPLYAPYWRTPLPIGLWAYNYLYSPKEKGFKYWFYRRLAKEPVLISKVQPQLRAKVAEQALGNNGYFGSQVSSELLYRKKGRKAKVNYTLRIAPPYHYGSIEYPQPGGAIGVRFDSLRSSSPLRPGDQYDLETLIAERSRITDTLRNSGYYYFRPQYLDYQADTTRGGRRADLRLRLLPATPPQALRPYHIRAVTVHLANIEPGPADTLHLGGATVVAQRPMKIRPRILERSLAIRPGQLFTVDAQSRTLTELNKLGIFRYVNLSVPVIDSLAGADSLDIRIDAQFDQPISADIETDVVSKSNSFLGPGIAFKVSHNNLFRGGEVLALKLNGSYEWQTGNKNSGGQSSRLNSYELGLNATLNIPRLLVPRSAERKKSLSGSTSFQLGLDLMNRPDYFRMISFGGSAGYDFSTSAYSHHTLTLLKLTYNKLLHTTQAFDQTMEANPTIAMSFRDQFVPAIAYTYTFDKLYGATGNRRFFWQNTVTSAGNILSGILAAFGRKHPQELFGNRFSQFLKEESELRFYHRLGQGNLWLATRFLVGVGYAYGNSEVMPYSEQFYIGGANSIRAFTVRSIGPGSYRPPTDDRNGYLDQTGDFKLEANVELRFGIMGRLNGAVFLDAGNIWLLKNDPLRPGAALNGKTFFNDIALGTGFGLRYDISYLVLRADLGIGIHTPYPNPDKKGYYNIQSFKDGLGFHLAIGYPF